MVDPRYSGSSLWGTGTHNTGENGDLHAHRRVYLKCVQGRLSLSADGATEPEYFLKM